MYVTQVKIQYSNDGKEWTEIKLVGSQWEVSKRDNKTHVFKALQQNN